MTTYAPDVARALQTHAPFAGVLRANDDLWEVPDLGLRIYVRTLQVRDDYAHDSTYVTPAALPRLVARAAQHYLLACETICKVVDGTALGVLINRRGLYHLDMENARVANPIPRETFKNLLRVLARESYAYWQWSPTENTVRAATENDMRTTCGKFE